jgi:hypothetical protein
MWVIVGLDKTRLLSFACLVLVTGAQAQEPDIKLPLAPCSNGFVFSPPRNAGGSYAIDASSFYNLGRIYDVSNLPLSAKHCLDKRSPDHPSELYKSLLSRVMDEDPLALQAARRIWSKKELLERLRDMRASKRYQAKTCEPQGLNAQAPAYYFALARKYEPIEGPEGAIYLGSRGVTLSQLSASDRTAFNQESCIKSFSGLTSDAQALSERLPSAKPKTKPDFLAGVPDNMGGPGPIGGPGGPPQTFGGPGQGPIIGMGQGGPPLVSGGKPGGGPAALLLFVNSGRALIPIGLFSD